MEFKNKRVEKMVNQSIINTALKYVHSIPENIGFRKAYLFGSYSKGLQNQDSDIDIAIILNKIDDFFDIQMQLMRLRRDIDLRIEAHPIQEIDFNLNNPFAYEILTHGFELK